MKVVGRQNSTFYRHIWSTYNVSLNKKGELENTMCKVTSGFTQVTLDGGLFIPNSDVKSWREKETILNITELYMDNILYLSDTMMFNISLLVILQSNRWVVSLISWKIKFWRSNRSLNQINGSNKEDASNSFWCE